jgi:hypothetical protein
MRCAQYADLLSCRRVSVEARLQQSNQHRTAIAATCVLLRMRTHKYVHLLQRDRRDIVSVHVPPVGNCINQFCDLPANVDIA